MSNGPSAICECKYSLFCVTMYNFFFLWLFIIKVRLDFFYISVIDQIAFSHVVNNLMLLTLTAPFFFLN